VSELIFGIVGLVVGVAGAVFGLIAALRNKKTDDKAEGKNDGVLHADIGYIKKGIDGIERRLEKQESQYVEVIRHLTEVESSAKQAHKRIDKLEQYHLPN
jgi:flagellar motor component MotA